MSPAWHCKLIFYLFFYIHVFLLDLSVGFFFFSFVVDVSLDVVFLYSPSI